MGSGRRRSGWPACGDRAGDARGALLVRLVGPPRRHPRLRQLPSLFQALPHRHVHSEHLLHEPRSHGAPGPGGHREGRAFRNIDGRASDLEADAGRLHLHRVRALPRGVPDGADRQAARPEGLHRRSPRRGLRGDTGDSGGDPPARERRLRRGYGGRRAWPLIGGWISEDTIWACTTCGWCTTACPVFIVPAVDKIVAMRRYLVLEKAEFPERDADRLPRDGDQRQPLGHGGRRSRRLGERAARRDDERGPGQGLRGPVLGRLRRLLRGPREARLEGSRRDPRPRRACPLRFWAARRRARATPPAAWATSTCSRRWRSRTSKS